MKISKRGMAARAAGILIAMAAAVFCGFLLAGIVRKTRFEHHRKAGIRYLEEMEYEEAVIAFTAAIRIEPKKMDVYLSLADAYVELDEKAKADQVLDTAFMVIRSEYEDNDRQLEKSELVLERLMSSYEEQGQEKKADEAKEWIIKISPDWKEKPEDEAEDTEEETSGEPEGVKTDENRPDSETEALIPDISEEELRTKLESAAAHEIIEFIYCDLDQDGIHEAVALTGINEDDFYMTEVELWYIDRTGASVVNTGIDQMGFAIDYWYLDVVDVGQEQHAVLDGNMMMGSMKQCFTYRLENGGLHQVYDGYGEIFMRDGRLWFGTEDYEGMETSDGMLGHTWKDYSICYEGGTYQECGGIEISKEFFMGYKDSERVWKQMLSEVLEGNLQAKYDAVIWYRGQGLITVDFAVYDAEGYRAFSHAYISVDNDKAVLLSWKYTDENGTVTDTFCTKSGILGENGTGLPVLYPDPPEHKETAQIRKKR